MSYSDPPFVEYATYRFGTANQTFRDQRPLSPPAVVACIGAAQTFGRFAAEPFPALLERRLRRPVLNFGTGGAGPEYFAGDPIVLSACATARVTILQVMSARSVSNEYFSVMPLRNARLGSVSPRLRELARGIDFAKYVFTINLLDELAKRNPPGFTEVVASLRSSWASLCERLLDRLPRPIILFWFAQRAPESVTLEGNARTSFPHFVDGPMVDALKRRVDRYVECVSVAGLPQSLLVDGRAVLFTPHGAPMVWNRYYPSPEMHALAADALTPVVRELAARS